MKTLKDFTVNGKRILVRCDFNVPLDKKGNVADDFRIAQALPTIKYLLGQNCKVIVMAHLDPDTVPMPNLTKVGERLSSLLNVPVIKESDCVGPEIESHTNEMQPRQVMLLENLRFHKEETENNIDFAKKLSFLGDIYVNDAFGVCHRNHASVSAITQFMPSCAGMLLEKEITTMDNIMKNPARPMGALVGGTKVETKAKFIENISQTADFVLVSGLIKKQIEEKGVVFSRPEKISGPVDSFDAPDINENTINIFKEKISRAKTILWNGPFGKFEDKKYEKGTLALAKAIIASKAFSVAGGGETVEFLAKHGIINKFSHVSTGGGAMLSYLAGDELPGLAALNNATK